LAAGGAVGLVAALVLAMAGCRSSTESDAAPTTTIRFWHTFNEAETATMIELIDGFQREHPDIRVEVTVLSFGSGRNRLLEAMRSGHAPDLARAEVAWIPEFADAGLVEDVSSEVELEAHVASIRPFFQWKGGTWAWPQAVDGLVLFYNVEQLAAAGQRPPGTMDELVRVGAALTVDAEGQSSLSATFDDARVARHGLYLKADGYMFLPFLWAFGGGTMDVERGEVMIGDGSSTKAARFMMDLRDRFGVALAQTDFSRDYEDELQRFGEGRVAMIINGPWATADILARPAFAEPGNLGIAPLPTGPGGSGGSPIGGHGYVIPKGHGQEAVRTLARYLSSPAAQQRSATKNHILPTLESVYADPAIQQNRTTAAFRAALAGSHGRAVFPGMARMFDALTPAIQRILRREVEPEVAFATVAEEWREILVRARAVEPPR